MVQQAERLQKVSKKPKNREKPPNRKVELRPTTTEIRGLGLTTVSSQFKREIEIRHTPRRWRRKEKKKDNFIKPWLWASCRNGVLRLGENCEGDEVVDAR